MDRRITGKKRFPRTFLLYGVVAVILLSIISAIVTQSDRGRILKVKRENLDISPVLNGVFEDFIPVRANVLPLNTVYLDAIEGGRVEKRWVEDGVTVEQGQLIVELSNTDLQLSVMRNEAEVIQQLNNMHSLELELEQNRLAHKRNLIEINYKIIQLTRRAKRQRSLISEGDIARDRLDNTEDKLTYYTKLKQVTLESQKKDLEIQEQQLTFLKHSSKRLQENLDFAQNNINKLKVRAPVAGKLSGFDVEIGQSIKPDSRLGQIDDASHFKLSARIDEFYIGRVNLAQKAKLIRSGKNYELETVKIYPQVKNGQFEVDMHFSAERPQKIRRGQTMQIQLTLGDSSNALLIPNGAFYQETGGNWVFIVEHNQHVAVKRSVKLGRRNSRYIEVLDGLKQAEKVIISSYASYQDVDRLEIKRE